MNRSIHAMILTAMLGWCAAFAAGAQQPDAAPDAPRQPAPEYEQQPEPEQQPPLDEQQQSVPAPMDNARLDALIRRIDSEAEGRPGLWRFTVREREVLVITDERADRMRILSAVAKADALEPELLYRLLQANFDTALDARYAIAKDVLWSAYIHPLAALGDAQFVSGIAQVVNLALTFGSTYSSGALSFGGGDSGELIRELMERLEAI